MNLNSLIDAAFQDADHMTTGHRVWAHIRIVQGSVYLDYGTIHTNGQREQAIGTISYTIQNGVIIRNKMVHV